MGRNQNHFFRFGPYRLESASRLLWKGDQIIPLTPRVVDTLLVLVKGAGALVTKEEILQAVWPDTHVEEGNLSQNISVLRRTFGTDGYIETLPKRGYRFTVPVDEDWGDPPMTARSSCPVEAAAREAPKQSALTPKQLLFLGAGTLAVIAIVVWITDIADQMRSASANPALPDTPAYLKYLDGKRELGQRTLAGVNKGIASFRVAIQEDSHYAPAYSGLADALILLGSYGVYSPREIFPEARKSAQKALTLDKNLAEAYASLGAIEGSYDWNWTGAKDEFTKAIRLKPGYATAHQWYAEQLSALGRHDEAIREAQRAVEADPHSATVISILGLTLYFAGQNEAALAQYQKALQFDRDHVITWFFLGYLYEHTRKFDLAASAYEHGVQLANGSGLAHLAHLRALTGHRDDAIKMLERLRETSAARYISPFDIALVYLGLGDKSAALTWLERAVEDHSEWKPKVDPRLDGIRSEPRFQALMQKMHLN